MTSTNFESPHYVTWLLLTVLQFPQEISNSKCNYR